MASPRWYGYSVPRRTRVHARAHARAQHTYTCAPHTDARVSPTRLSHVYIARSARESEWGAGGMSEGC